MMKDTFGRRLLERLGPGSLNWEDDVKIIDEMADERLRKRTLERDAVAADAQHLAEESEDLRDEVVGLQHDLALAYDALIEISHGTGAFSRYKNCYENLKATAVAALEVNK